MNLNKFTYNLFYLLLFSPILSYITLAILGIGPITAYFIYAFSAYGIYFTIINAKRIIFPKLLILLICYSIFLSIWEIINGGLAFRGLIQIIFNKPIMAIVFIIIIIYNTHFSTTFIKNSIQIFKITVFIAAIVSTIQIIEFSFLDASPIWAQGKLGDTLMGNIYEDRRNSIFGYVNQNELGLSYMPLLSVLIGSILFERKKYTYAFLTLGAITAFLSNNRYVIIAFFLITLQLILHKKKKASAIFMYVLSTSIILIISIQILTLFGYNISDWFSLRLFHEGSIQETTRYKAIDNFLIFFHRHIFWGTGVFITDEIRAASRSIGSSQIHVGYLAHLVSYGLVGSFFLFGFWFLLAKKLFQSARQTNFWGSFIAFSIFLWANFTLVYYSIFFYGIIYALIFDKYYSDIYNFKNKLIK